VLQAVNFYICNPKDRITVHHILYRPNIICCKYYLKKRMVQEDKKACYLLQRYVNGVSLYLKVQQFSVSRSHWLRTICLRTIERRVIDCYYFINNWYESKDWI